MTMSNFNFNSVRWIVLLYIHFPVVSSYHTMMCMGTVESPGEHSIGQGSHDYHTNKLASASHGNEKCFDSAETLLNTWTPYYIVYNSTDFIDTTDEGNTLFGWISISINVRDGLEAFVVHASVPNAGFQYNSGEFVTTRLGGSCQENFEGQPCPKVHLAPCYYVSDPSPTVPIGVTYVGARLKNLRLTFRTDFPECSAMNENSNLEFRLYANRDRPASAECNEVRIRIFTAPQSRTYVKDITYGGYDPEPPRESDKISCGTHLKSPNRWVLKYEGSALDSASVPAVVSGSCYSIVPRTSSFVGRCSRGYNISIGSDSTYKCHPDTKQKEGPEYVPQNPPGKGICDGCRLSRNKTREIGLASASSIGQNIWGLRSTHGIAMAWTAMAIIPLSTLLSRYYKETLMKYRYVNFHVWHGVHVATACTGFAGLLSGWVAAFVGRQYFGFSKNRVSYVHWILGYLSMLSFLVAFFGSSVRIFERRMRLLTIFFHFLVGSVSRICWTICLLTSLYIPGSPSATNDVHISGFTMEPALAIIIPWIIVDVAVHVFLMVNLKSTDKNARFPTVRTYAIAVPIPLIRPDDETDFPGAGLKIILLIVHLVVGILCAVLLSIFICLTSSFGRFFGQMWYTHKDSGKLNMLMEETYYN